MQRWEYMTYDLVKRTREVDELDRLGRDGWEAVGMVSSWSWGLGEAAAGPEDAGGLPEHLGLVDGEVDDAVGEDDVDGGGGEGDGLGLVGASEVEHLVGRVQAIGLACGADAAGAVVQAGAEQRRLLVGDHDALRAAAAAAARGHGAGARRVALADDLAQLFTVDGGPSGLAATSTASGGLMSAALTLAARLAARALLLGSAAGSDGRKRM